MYIQLKRKLAALYCGIHILLVTAGDENQSRKMLKDEKKQEKLTLGFVLADGAAGEAMKDTTSVQKTPNPQS